MNKLHLRAALKSGFSLENSFIKYKNHQIELNSFFIEMNKLQFTHSIQSSLNILIEKSYIREKMLRTAVNEFYNIKLEMYTNES